MTTGQTMLTRCTRPIAAALVLGAALAPLPGCASRPELTPPAQVTAPYDNARGDVLWAVVPLRNETGTTTLDAFAISDKVVAAAAQVRGLRVLPLNRTIATMRAISMPQLATPADAKRLATEMGVDGLIVGSITAYDPYNPPTLGLSLAIYARPGAMEFGRPAAMDVRQLQYQPTDYQYFPRSTHTEAPASVISEHLDAKNHQVLMDVQEYAQGRHDPKSAYGWKRYVASMDLFSEFAASYAVGRLLEHEWIRLAETGAQARK
jgi:hypothetical protein